MVRGTPEFDRFQIRSKATERVFVLESSYEERATPKSAGFWFQWDSKRWWTTRPHIAAKLVGIAECDPALAAEISAVKADRDETLAMSRADDAAIDIPVPAGLAYRLVYVAIVTPEGATLGAAEYGTPGYRPMRDPERFETYQAASEEANVRNELMGWTAEQALEIVCDTMRRQEAAKARA